MSADDSATGSDDFDLENQPEPVPAPKPQSNKGPLAAFTSFSFEIIVAIILALIVTAIGREFVFQVFRVPSGSMEQTLEERDRIAAIRVADWQRGDIVVFEDRHGWLGQDQTTSNPILRGLEVIKLLPDSSKSYLVKRVIGIPGDEVSCCNQEGKVSVNGVALDEESYLYRNSDGTTVDPSEIQFDVIVPQDQIFVLGDHRNRSADSRVHMCQVDEDGVQGEAAFIPEEAIVGPVKAIVLPLNRITTFSTPDTFKNVPDPSGQAPSLPVIGSGTC